MTRPPKCVWCHRPAKGVASINGERFCHGVYASVPSCYQRGLWSASSFVVGQVAS